MGICVATLTSDHCAQVHRVFTRGAAGFEGTIQRGDNILSINGISLEGKTHGEAVACLHQARVSSQALVVVRRGRESGASLSQTAGSVKKTYVEAGAGKCCIQDQFILTLCWNYRSCRVLNYVKNE